jgi:hypothetical protein
VRAGLPHAPGLDVTGSAYCYCLPSSFALLRRFGRAHAALAVHPGAIETAGIAPAARELVASGDDALVARLGLLAGGDPVDPVASRHRRDVGPCRLGVRVGRQRLAQIGGQLGFGLLLHRRDLQRDAVARGDTRGLAQGLVDLEPVTAPAIRFQRGLEGLVFKAALDGDHAPRRQLRARDRWQHQESPRRALGRRGARQLCLELDHRGGFGHDGTVAPVVVIGRGVARKAG